MRSDLPPLSAATALVFPGQGAHGPAMLDSFRDSPALSRHYREVCRLLGGDPLERAVRDPDHIDRNAVSSLLTVLASVACLDRLRARNPEFVPAAVAGYSVGQWSAIYAAGLISVEDLLRVVAERARVMDACLSAGPRGGMLAVVGLRADALDAVCREAGLAGELLEIANHNAPGQFTLAGSLAALDLAEARLAPLHPKRLLRLRVAGAFHTRLLEGAVAPLSDLLARLPLGAQISGPSIPVIDNTTGDWLPDQNDARRTALAVQVARPVLWMQGLRTLAAAGVRQTIEVGYGDVLTKFNFFTDRSLAHCAASPPPRG